MLFVFAESMTGTHHRSFLCTLLEGENGLLDRCLEYRIYFVVCVERRSADLGASTGMADVPACFEVLEE